MHKMVALAALLSIASPALADFDAGCAAFDRGDHAAAQAEWEPLARQGQAKSQFRLGCLYAFGQVLLPRRLFIRGLGLKLGL